MSVMYYELSLILAVIAAIALDIAKDSVIHWEFLKRILKKLPLLVKFLILLSIFLVFSFIANAVINISILPTDPEARQTAIAMTQTELAIEQSNISLAITNTAEAMKKINTNLPANPTLEYQLASIAATQASLRYPIIAKVDPSLPVNSINVRSTPDLANNSNIVGALFRGDTVIVTGWTNHPYTWCRIDVPNKNQLHNVWISCRVSVNSKVYNTLILEGFSSLPSQLYIDYETPMPNSP
jgi:hypothetical protein